MWEPFTEHGKQAIIRAVQEACRLGHLTGTEHMLFGLIADRTNVASDLLTFTGVNLDCVSKLASEILTFTGVNLDCISKEMHAAIGQCNDGPRDDRPVFTLAAKRAIELAFQEARAMEQNYIGTEHLLLGLMLLDECPASNILAECGADLTKIRARLQSLLGINPVE